MSIANKLQGLHKAENVRSSEIFDKARANRADGASKEEAKQIFDAFLSDIFRENEDDQFFYEASGGQTSKVGIVEEDQDMSTFDKISYITSQQIQYHEFDDENITQEGLGELFKHIQTFLKTNFDMDAN